MSKQTNTMSPESSPNTPYGGKRVNNTPIIILGVCLAAFLGIVMLVGMDRAKIRETDEDQKPAEDSTAMAKQIVGDMSSGFVNPPDVVTESTTATLEVSDSTVLKDKAVESGGIFSAAAEDPWAAERKVIKQQTFKMLTAAITSDTQVKLKPVSLSKNNISSSGSNRNQLLEKIAKAKRMASQVESTDPTTAYKTRLAAIKASGLVGENGLSNLGGGNSNTNNFGDSLFDPGDDWTLKNKINAPKTAFTLRAGFVIPGIMITGINSELPGRISGQISQNVYDTAMGTHLLLPQGTRLDGSYVNDVAYGQSRMLIAWNRLIFPDGKALDIGSMPGTDSAGYSGFSDQVDNHYFRIFGSAFLMSGVTAAMSYGTRDDISDKEKPFSDTLSESLATNLGEVALAMVKKNLNISPTLNIRPGYRFNILVVKDMEFKKPYQQFDY